MKDKIPTIPRGRRPKLANSCFSYESGDLIVIPFKKRWILGVISKIREYPGVCICSWGDHTVRVPKNTGFVVHKKQVKREISEMVGASFISIQDARVKLTPFRIQ